MMSSAKPPSSDLPGERGSRRRGPTIDLKATEIAGDTAAAADTSAMASESAALVAAAQSSVEEPPTASAQPSDPAPTGGEPGASEREINLSDETKGSGTEKPASEWSPQSTGRTPFRPWLPLGSGAAGAVLALLVFSLFGLFSSHESGPSALDARLARLEQQVVEIAGRPTPTSADPKAMDDLAGRLARLEATPAVPRAPANDAALANRLATLEGEMKALGERVGVVARRGDDIATVAGDARTRSDATATAITELQKVRPGPPEVERREVEVLANRVTALEQAEKALETKFTQSTARQSPDRAVRLAVTAALLQAAVERGDPFAAELAFMKGLKAEPAVLAPLEPFAAKGVPSVAALARELSILTPALRQASGAAPRDGNFLNRLAANAEKIVRIRSIDDTPGDDPAAIVARIELRAAQSDLAGALAELAKLSPAARALAQDWIGKAEARNAALALSRRVASDALAALGQPPSEGSQPQ
jgi:hypothetical protein